jgi:hypothetical protein
LFRRVPRDGVAKGFAQFEGLAVITGVELVTQFSNRAGGTFANYAFELLVMSLSAEHELLDYRWVSDRRDRALTTADTLTRAPRAWKDWVAHGATALERVRRRVSKLLVEPKAHQLPAPGTKEDGLLAGIYAYYEGKKHRFEALAQIVAERVIDAPPGSYLPGGLTRASAGSARAGTWDFETDALPRRRYPAAAYVRGPTRRSHRPFSPAAHCQRDGTP